jgi:uncharacterized protein (DUF362 family)
MPPPNSKHYDIVISRQSTSKEALIKGLEMLGGISKLISPGDSIFIKLGLASPLDLPVSLNLEILRALVSSCIDAGSKKIIIGGFSNEEYSLRNIEGILKLGGLLKDSGAEISYLDELTELVDLELPTNSESIKIPKIIMDCEKLIILNQIKVHPLFNFTPSILNLFSLISPKYQRVSKIEKQGKDYLQNDQYLQDLVSKIIDLYELKKPDLTINDLFTCIEQAGPDLYTNSISSNKQLLIMGKNMADVDLITTQLLNLDYKSNPLLSEVKLRGHNSKDLDQTMIGGTNLDDIKIDFNPPVSKLDEIQLFNCVVKKGRFCSGCREQAYYFLNIMKTYLIKDLKYTGWHSLLIGENPIEPDPNGDVVLLFGDCAINSTKQRSFRKTRIMKESISPIAKLIKLIKKNYKPKIKQQVKEKRNTQILELSGCPPTIFNCFKEMIEFYGKSQAPNLNSLSEIYESISKNGKMRK